jgi:hypothetical protein
MPADLKLVKDGLPEADPDLLALADEAARDLVETVETVKAGGGFWLLLDDDDEPRVKLGGDNLVLSATAEEAARKIKMVILGLDE